VISSIPSGAATDRLVLHASVVGARPTNVSKS
jgi:hypothetical protein